MSTICKYTSHKIRQRTTGCQLWKRPDGIEDTEHFLLLCPSFDNQRQHLLAGISVAVRPFVQLNILSNNDLMNLLLYGDEDLPSDINKRVLECTLNFIRETVLYLYILFFPFKL